MVVDYRKSEFTEEIIALFEGYVQNKWPLLVWQTHSRHEAKHGVVTDFHIPSKTISVKANLSQFDVNQAIFCKGEEKEMVFKSSKLKNENNQFQIVIPDDVRLEELRSNQRFEMFSNKKAFVTASIPSHYDSKDTSYVFKLSEISQSGCSLIMASGNLKYFHIGDAVKILQIGSDILNYPISAVVKHLQPMRVRGQADVQLYKVGIRFDKKISFFNYYLTKNLER